MAESKNIALMAHLMRRAGFGANREELEMRVAKGYEATVEELLDPNGHGVPDLDDREICRHNPGYVFPSGNQPNAMAYWVYRMINSKRPLEEKIALYINDICIMESGIPIPFPRDSVVAIMSGEEVAIRLNLNLGSESATAWGCNLSEEYVTFNSAYTT